MSESGADTTAYSAAATPVLSPSSSMGSLSSEKSTLNPNAKEFRLNPKATSFVPTPSLLRPVSPVNDASFYYPSSASSVPHMHAMPVGIGVGPSFATPQPVLFNPQAETMQSQQAYYASNGPQYAQHMIIGHPNQVMYMPGYPACYSGKRLLNAKLTYGAELITTEYQGATSYGNHRTIHVRYLHYSAVDIRK